MSDAGTVHIGENSPEYVAYRLMLDVFGNESRPLTSGNGKVPQKMILDTYAECLNTVQGPNLRVNLAVNDG